LLYLGYPLEVGSAEKELYRAFFYLEIDSIRKESLLSPSKGPSERISGKLSRSSISFYIKIQWNSSKSLDLLLSKNRIKKERHDKEPFFGGY
jgi:hypothetical protein